MNDSSKPNIAFIGTGLMGGPMARCLLREGFPLKVWNRTHSKAESLKELGATVLDSPSEAVKDAKVLITMLKDGPAVDEVVFRQGVATYLPPGSIHVDMGSIGLDQAVEHGERHAIRGIRYLDAPVSGGTKGAKAGDLAIMVGGDSETFAEVVPVFEAMGRPTHVGPTGCGQLSKLANQVIVAITIGAVSEASYQKDRYDWDLPTCRGGDSDGHDQNSQKAERCALQAIEIVLDQANLILRGERKNAGLIGRNYSGYSLLKQIPFRHSHSDDLG